MFGAPGGEVIPVGAVGAQGVDRLRRQQEGVGLRLPGGQRVPDIDGNGDFRGSLGFPVSCGAVSGAESIERSTEYA
jgi:hypothetical protein